MKQEKDKNRSPNKEQARNINDLKEELVGEFGVDAKTLSNKTYDQIKKMNESSWRARKGLEESLKSSTGGMFEDLQKQMKNRGQ
jgi:hypothetical protein